MNKRILGVIAAALVAAPIAAQADLITSGFTFSVADDFFGDSFEGTHYHSSTGGDFGNPDGKAEVGGFFGTEEVRGLSEYDLTGISAGGTAFVSFDVYLADGLFGQGGGPFVIDIYAYQGNNLEDLSDWQAVTTAFVYSFSTADLLVGDILSFDIASVLDAAIGSSWDSLGIRLQPQVRDLYGPAFTFDDFRLTTDSLCTGAVCGEVDVPEPGTLALFGLGLAGLGFARRRKTA